ncbi:MAG: hypothetical protein LBP22_02900 [Deltaproteobacteria bacterium]|jgi:hypothetical protein|nr:hypothetical protein [Deltaproteobacteria bacterium]
MPKNLWFFLLILAVVCPVASTAYGQPEKPKLLFYGSEEGFFCGFEPSQSGDGPGEILVKRGRFIFRLWTSFSSEKLWTQLETLKPDVPLKFDFIVVNDYDESGGERTTFVGIRKFEVTGDPVPGSCKNGKIP